MFLAIVVVIPAAVYLYESSQPKVYQSSALVEVSGGPQTGIASLFNEIVESGPNTAYLLSAARLIDTTGFAHQAAKYIHPRPADPDSLLGDISASADTNTGFMTLTGTANSPSGAADVANAFAQALVFTQTSAAVAQFDVAIAQLKRELAATKPGNPNRATLSSELARFQALRAVQGSNAKIVQTALNTGAPISPKVSRAVLLGIVMSLLLGLAAVAVLEVTDRRIRHPNDIVELTGLPLLSAIPEAAFSAEGAMSHEVREAFATLRASLTFYNVDTGLSSVLVTSPGKADGKTTVAVALARSFANAGKQVVLVDADLRRPAVAARLGLPNESGLGAVLAGEIALEDAILEPPSSNGHQGRLRVLPAGPPPPNPSELLGSNRMQALFTQLIEQSDILVIDSTPMLTVSDSMPLLKHVSGLALVARINQTSGEAMTTLRQVAESAGGRPFGLVTTGAASGGLYVAEGYDYSAVYSAGEAPARGRSWLGGRQSRESAVPADAEDVPEAAESLP